MHNRVAHFIIIAVDEEIFYLYDYVQYQTDESRELALILTLAKSDRRWRVKCAFVAQRTDISRE